MRSFVIALLLFVPVALYAQTGTKIVLGTIDVLRSAILNEDREVDVYVPASAADPSYAKRDYPVVYLLDGDAHFYTVAAMIRQLSQANANTEFPEMIVVGIPNTKRTRDLTPTHVDKVPGMDDREAKSSGGGEKFMAFIENELIPHIDSAYPTAPYRVLIGHSLGGLTAINALINHTGLFNACLAIDPSMSWDEQRLLKQARTELEKDRFEKNSLFLAVANTMEHGMDTAMAKGDTTRKTLHIRSILQLARYLDTDKRNGLHVEWKYYPGYDHDAVPFVAEYDGLRSIFSFYDLHFPYRQFFDPSYKGDTLIAAHFAAVSRRMGYRVTPPEHFINGLGYSLLGAGQYDRALSFFNMNIANYPGSANTYDSMGDLYGAIGNKQKAIEYYKKALAISNYSETRKKLERLEN
jgi:predicted alpha/beta superfamily hydrolase